MKSHIALESIFSSKRIIFFITLFSFVATFFFINWKDTNTPFRDDVDQYYSWLPATFIHQDLTFKNNEHGYWLIPTQTNKVVPKVTYGVALLYSPFFLLAKIFSAPNSSGYEPAFSWLVHFGCIIYVLIGLWYTRKVLLFFFNEIITSLALVFLFFGTNLFYYTLAESESAHGVLFFLTSLFVYHVLCWHFFDVKKSFVIFCFTYGVICLIRPTECLVILLPLFIGVTSKELVKAKFLKIVKLKWVLLFGLLCFFIPLIPQFLYWKMQSGNYLFFSYGSVERFFWNDPQIINVFFSYRKGFFIYTPIMILAIFGFYFLFKNNKNLFLPVFLYFILNVYFVCAWWDWSFGGSFGMRAFVHCYAILILPLAYFIQWLIGMFNSAVFKKAISVVFFIFAFMCCCLNVLDSNLYKHAIIHHDGMTKQAYYFTLFKKHYSNQDLEYLKTLYKSPNYDERRKGNRND